jgi:hypothetical protein
VEITEQHRYEHETAGDQSEISFNRHRQRSFLWSRTKQELFRWRLPEKLTYLTIRQLQNYATMGTSLGSFSQRPWVMWDESG